MSTQIIGKIPRTFYYSLELDGKEMERIESVSALTLYDALYTIAREHSVIEHGQTIVIYGNFVGDVPCRYVVRCMVKYCIEDLHP